MVMMQSSRVSDLEYVRSKSLKAHMPSSVFAGFFGRRGGVSTDAFASLNCGRGSSDDAEAVRANLGIVADEVGVDVPHLLTLHQIHSARCIVVEEPWDLEERPEADAMVTKVPGVALGILTADCAPVLFYGEDADGQSVIGAAHAGWGGAFGGVLEATVDQMETLGAKRNRIYAVVGPCIAQESYEVGGEFQSRFLDADERYGAFFIPSEKEGHFMFDLSGFCREKLILSGVGRVFVTGLDTYYNEDDFFSYRRATHRGEVDYGRQISVIALR